MLDPHVLRLRPRSDVTQQLRIFKLDIHPETAQIVEAIDLDGNATIKLWFPAQKATGMLKIQVVSEVETFRTNPFDFLVESWAVQLPINYPSSLLRQLRPYLQLTQDFPFTQDPIANQLAQDTWLHANGDTVSFLTELNRHIHQHCDYIIRETGDPLPPSITWNQKAGSCRDLALLFIEACRAMGLAARFVSGYQEGDPDVHDLHLHAWAEVYIPGAGWRGYDPTNNIAVGDRHVALVASPFTQQTKPISGSLKHGSRVCSEMKYDLKIKVLVD
jgi:transglutaminase-like putative cysteine protease